MNQNQPILYISLRSPFARRIRLALHRLGIPFTLKTVDVLAGDESLSTVNPLGMVPTLITSDGVITDSQNILEYLNDKTGAIWPKDFSKKIEAKQTAVWASGLMQSLVLYFQELKLHEVPSPKWLKDHTDEMNATLALLAKAPSGVWFTLDGSQGGLTQAAWDLCVALEYMSLRLPELHWKERYPAFHELLAFARKDSYFCETTPPA